MAGTGVFVGRAGELSRLRSALGERARLVLVVGDAGIGKTRFVAEGLARRRHRGQRRQRSGRVIQTTAAPAYRSPATSTVQAAAATARPTSKVPSPSPVLTSTAWTATATASPATQTDTASALPAGIARELAQEILAALPYRAAAPA
jgi:AAA ATPase domain